VDQAPVSSQTDACRITGEIVMSPRTSPLVSHLRSRGVAYLVLILGSALSGLFAWNIQHNSEHRAHGHFDDAVQQAVRALEQRVTVYADNLTAMAALFHSSETVTRREFQTYANTLRVHERYPGIQSLGFIRRVHELEKQLFAQQMREEHRNNPCGYPDFPIFPSHVNTEYFLVVFVEPIARNRALFGRDLLTEPACRDPMERARDTGMVSASERITLRHGDRDKAGFVMLLPLYQPGSNPRNTEDRRRALTGFVFGNFLVEDFFRGIFGQRAVSNLGIDLEVFDGREPGHERLLYDDDSILHSIGTERPDAYRRTVGIDVGGRTWSLNFISLPAFHDTHGSRLPDVFLFFGILLSFMLYRAILTREARASEKHRYTEMLERQARHDALTNLPNRGYLLERLAARLKEGDGSPGNMALLLIDLNGFKEINDTLGHQSGDKLLQQIGPRLQKLLRPTDVLARLGGDEFGMMLAPLRGVSDAEVWARRVIDEIHRPFELDGITVQIDASVGIALHPAHGTDGSTLLRCADVAMYVAKKNHHGYAVYQPELDMHSPRQLSLMSQIEEAMRREQLALYYQPKIRLRGGKVIGVEALIRWHHPEEGLIPPGEFIPQVERSTLIRPFTLWVIEHALMQCRQWQDANLPTRVAVNISARNLLDTELPDDVEKLLVKHRMTPDFLEFEITESAIVADPERALDILTKLHERGVNISIDDFGTGYSSLAHLKKLPVSNLKIDASFVSDMTEDENDAIIVRSTVDLSHNLGLSVIAEGVEDRATLDILQVLDCDYAQGFFICRPIPASDVTTWLRQHAPKSRHRR
jgi:diguanylate cyclase (GGDEF)-like protein